MTEIIKSNQIKEGVDHQGKADLQIEEKIIIDVDLDLAQVIVKVETIETKEKTETETIIMTGVVMTVDQQIQIEEGEMMLSMMNCSMGNLRETMSLKGIKELKREM